MMEMKNTKQKILPRKLLFIKMAHKKLWKKQKFLKKMWKSVKIWKSGTSVINTLLSISQIKFKDCKMLISQLTKMVIQFCSEKLKINRKCFILNISIKRDAFKREKCKPKFLLLTKLWKIYNYTNIKT